MDVDINKLKREDRIEYLLKDNNRTLTILEFNPVVILMSTTYLLYTIFFFALGVVNKLQSDLVSFKMMLLISVLWVIVGIFLISFVAYTLLYSFYLSNKLKKEYFSVEAKK